MKANQSFKPYIYIAFALMILITIWESNRTDAAVITPAIPQESIRIRILANSDSAQDQALKGVIRDAVVASMQNWVNGPQTIEQARSIVTEHLPELDLLVGDMIRDRGYSYSHEVKLGVVPFPAKLFGNEVYPAGEYEALRITIGSGEGQNWWCVLFPPLCFVDTFTGESAAAKSTTAPTKPGDKSALSAPAPGTQKKVIVNLSQPVKPSGTTNLSTIVQPAQDASAAEKPADIEVRFFLWDLFDKVASWFK
jgi:stage II sporulation protein R